MNMDANEINARILKAAAVGADQSLKLRGFDENVRSNVINAYVAPNNGLLAKRASARFEEVKRRAYIAITAQH